MIIEFKEISNHKGYFISKDGIAISKKAGKGTRRSALAQHTNKGGRFYVSLFMNGKRKKILVHRLVAITYLKNKKNKPQVNHINGDHCDNRLEDLEWVTDSENKKHAARYLGRRGGNSRTKSKRIDSLIPEIENLISGGVKQKQIALRYNISCSIISRIKTKDRSCFKNYEFQERILL